MNVGRRELIGTMFAAGALRSAAQSTTSATKKLGIPGAFRGRVVAVEHPGSIVGGKYQREPVRDMVHKGLMELTGASTPAEAWRYFFEPGDVVGIKVNPVGQPYIISKAEVFQEIVAGLEMAGVKRPDIVAYDRYHDQFLSGGFDKWLPDGVRWTAATRSFSNNPFQLDMEGYDQDNYVELPLLLPKAPPNDRHYRRSYVCKWLSKEVNKVVNLGVLKHHQSAGITIALKNLSHGMVNNVSRSHVSSMANTCGTFIPAVVDLPAFRQKIVLNVIDGIQGAYHGGPGGRVRKYIWDHKTMYFATDPVAVDRIGWGVLDDKRQQMGMQTIELAPADQDSNFVRMQPEHVLQAGLLGLGEGDERKIDLKKIKLNAG